MFKTKKPKNSNNLPKKIKRASNQPTLLRGFKDLLPEHMEYWQYVCDLVHKLLSDYEYGRIEVPVLEQTNLYKRTTGEHTDIVTKEMFSFEDRSGDSVSLRPEFTPGIARAYIEHGMLNKPQPVKFYSLGPVFRHDNPQAGRFRQFHQLDLEAIGSDSPVIDAQLILIAYRLLESLGLPITVHVNSIGCRECRPEYISQLKQYLSAARRKKSLCETCRERYTKNPLRILDCREETCQEILVDAPQIVDSLCEDCKPSENWLGNFSPKEKIIKSGLWLVNELWKTPLSDEDMIELKQLLNID